MAKSSSKSSKVTKKVSKSKKVESSSSESESSSSSSSSSSESESESEEEVKEKKSKKSKKEESSSSESESSSDSSSDSDSDSDSESEKEEKKEKKVKKEESSSSDSSDSESEKEDKKKEESSSSSDSESSDSDSSSDSESEKEDKKESKTSSSSSSSSSSESSSESSSDSDSDSDEEEEKTETKKRKADSDVEEEQEESESKRSKVEEEPATLFVGRLSWSIDDEWLRREFEPLGGVISARVIMERSTGKSRGYGYVDFSSKSAAEKALQEYQGREIDGRPINLDMSTGKPHTSNPRTDRAKQFGDVPSAPSDTLFVGNLSFNAQRDNLFNIFGEYGSVISCRIPTHPDTQQPKGFGYVQFSSVDEAKSALEALNGEYLEGRPCRLDYSTPKDPSNSAPRGGFGGRGGFNGGRGGRGGFNGGRGGRDSGFGGRERSATPRAAPNNAEFKGTKKTFD